jgi:excisionase family DNA binding protein
MDGKKEKKFFNIGEASALTGIGSQTLRKMADDNQIPSFKTISGHRRFSRAGIQKLCEGSGPHKDPRTSRANFLYTRVSSKKQLDDLLRQVEHVKRPEYSGYSLIQDVGSGINFKRKGIQTILDHCIQGTIGEIVVAHRDRLSRFGYDLIEAIVLKAGGKITLLDDHKDKSSEQELADDLLSIVHIFSCRQMGKRNYKKSNKDENLEDKAVPDEETERTLQEE